MRDLTDTLRTDELDIAGRRRVCAMEVCEIEALAWHAAVLEAENAELRAALRTTVTAVQAPIYCCDHVNNCCLSWCKRCQACHANLVAEEEAVQKAEELLKRIEETR